MSKRVMTLLRNLVALQPLRRRLSDGGLLLDMTRMDDRKQWLVLNVSRKVWEAGLIKVHDHVIVDSQMEPLYEFDDKIAIADAKWIVGVVGDDSAGKETSWAGTGMGAVPPQLPDRTLQESVGNGKVSHPA